MKAADVNKRKSRSFILFVKENLLKGINKIYTCVFYSLSFYDKVRSMISVFENVLHLLNFILTHVTKT